MTTRSFLRRGSLQGARIGRDVRYFDYSYYGSGIPGDADGRARRARIGSDGKTWVQPIVDCDTGDVFEYTDDEFTALLYEFKAQIAQYLATLTNTNMRTLADLIAFNEGHCQRELVYYGQDIFELGRTDNGLSHTIPCMFTREHTLRFSPPWHRQCTRRPQSGCDRRAAPHEFDRARRSGLSEFVASVGIRPPSGRPAGMLMYSTFLREPKLIGFAYDLEQRDQGPETAAIPTIQ